MKWLGNKEGPLALVVIGAIFLLLISMDRGGLAPDTSSKNEASASESRHVDDAGNADEDLASRISRAFASVEENLEHGIRPQPGAFPYRVSNTLEPLDQLARNPSALILNNALLDSRIAFDLAIPDHLLSDGDPGSYIVQSSVVLDASFAESLERVGARVVSYIPNNAYLVRAEASVAATLSTRANVAAVVPFEPFYKLAADLLPAAVNQRSIEDSRTLHVVGFNGDESSLRAFFETESFDVLGGSPTPFGPSFVIAGAKNRLPELARRPDVQYVGQARPRALGNDLARPRVGAERTVLVPAEDEDEDDTLALTNYLGLTGIDIPVNVNDTGVDETHPDLANRVFPGDPNDLDTTMDANGHGTHVAGTIASSGENSPGATEDGDPAAYGSDPEADFKGLAPAATIHALPIELGIGPTKSDNYLITKAAEKNYLTLSRTNPMVSNNSWGYVNAFDYDFASATYDAAVRDALPEVSGDQSLVYVFAAGNEGEALTDGRGGVRGTIRSPGNAKNVITVGAIETFRSIDKEFRVTNIVDGEEEVITNLFFLADTDSRDQVASFSGRGNVAIGVEGDDGRFKPDVVAPGTYVVSTRASGWESPQTDIETDVNWIRDQSVSPGELDQHILILEDDVSSVTISVVPNSQSTNPNGVPLPIYASYEGLATLNDFVGNEEIDLPADFELRSDATLNYAIGAEDREENYDIRVVIRRINEGGDDFLNQLAEINEPLAPHYRYESGTSMAAPVVSGALALMQEYLEENEFAYSAALLKAMLINGSRSVNTIYHPNPGPEPNAQGWGLINLTNSLPATPMSAEQEPASVRFVNQDPDLAVTTGEERSWKVSVSEDGRESDLRVTLVWTDPPGNPTAGIKLVNDLDLIVTNLVSGTVVEPEEQDEEPTILGGETNIFLGNLFDVNEDYVRPLGLDQARDADVINNVENVFIRGPLNEGEYILTVRGSRVNVNSVTDHPDKIAQDYALVASLTDTSIENGLTVTPVEVDPQAPLAIDVPSPTTITNGVPLFNQRASANSPLRGELLDDVGVGTPEQWRFYVFTNSLPTEEIPEDEITLTNGANIAFITFFPPNVSSPARNRESDLDIYVSRGDEGLLTLNPDSIANATKSVGPGGTEQVVFEDAELDEVFYIGVKAEDQRAGEFGFVGLSSDEPFNGLDDDGNPFIRGLPVNVTVPDGDAITPGQQLIFAPGIRPELINSVWVETAFVSDDFGDLLGNLSHNGQFAVLFNNSLDFGLFDETGLPEFDSIIFDDSDSGVRTGINVRPSDGPGSLMNFLGEAAAGPWIMAIVDNQPEGETTVNQFVIRYSPLQELSNVFISGEARPNQFSYFVADSPSDAERMIVTLRDMDPALPLQVLVQQDEPPTLDEFAKRATIAPPGGQLVHSARDAPPFNPGRHFVGVFNPNDELVRFQIRVEFESNPDSVDFQSFTMGPEEPIELLDEAYSEHSINIDSARRISDMRVGVRIDHPRVSDLDLRLLSPDNKTVLLTESRGTTLASQYGTSLGGTNHSFAVFTTVTNLTELDETVRRPIHQDSLEPIKFSAPPYYLDESLLVADNSLLKEEDFNEIDPGVYPIGHDFGNLVTKFEEMEILLEDPEDEDSNHFLFLEGGLEATFDTRVGRDYLVTIGFRAAEDLPAVVQVMTNGVRSGSARYTSADGGPNREGPWITSTHAVRARETETLFEARPLRPVAESDLDFIRFEEVGVLPDIYYLSEEPLRLLTGDRALGEWRLQIDDRRAGPTPSEVDQGIPSLLDWKIEARFAAPDIEAPFLTNGVPYIGSIANDEIKYFRVEVPLVATMATNVLSGQGDLVLSGDREGTPVGDPLEDDYYEDRFGVDQGELLLLSTTEPPAAPLEPGQTYYLGVQNFAPDETNTFQIAVFFDNAGGFDETTVTELMPDVTESGDVEPDGLFDYWRVTVDDEEIDARIQVDSEVGNVDLYARHFSDPTSIAPLPTTSNFDGLSTNVPPELDSIRIHLNPDFSANNELQLDVGTWFIGAINRADDATQYELTYTETLADITDLEDGVEVVGALDPGMETSDGFTVDYYRFDVPGLARETVFETFEATGDIVLALREGAPVPSIGSLPINRHYFSSEFGSPEQRIVVDGRSTPVPLTPGPWYLSVFNFGDTEVDYKIRAVTEPINPIAVANEELIEAEINIGERTERPVVDYYSFDVTPNAERLRVELDGMTGEENLDLLMVYGLQNGPPSDTNFDYPNEISNVNPAPAVNPTPGAPEAIDVRPNSLPTPLQPGTWYIAVVYRGTDESAPPSPYTLWVKEFLPEIRDLEIDDEVTETIDDENEFHEYRIEVPETIEALRVDAFDIVGDVDLYVRQGERATSKLFDLSSENAEDTSEAAHFSVYSGSPVLVPGEWFITVYNRNGGASDYSLRASGHTPGLTRLERGDTVRVSSRFLDQIDRFQYEIERDDIVELGLRTAVPPLGISAGDPAHSLHLSEGDLPELDGSDSDVVSDEPDTGRQLAVAAAGFTDTPEYFAPGLWTGAVFKELGLMSFYDYEITADPIVGLSDGFESTETIVENRGVDFYRLDFPPGGSSAEIRLDGLSGNVDLLVGDEFTPEQLSEFTDFTSRNPDLDPESVRIEGSVIEETRQWYIAVVSRSNGSVDYTIEATISGDPIVALEDEVERTDTLEAGSTRWYSYDISSTGVRLSLDVFDISSDISVFARDSFPLPTPTNFDLRSANPGLADERLDIFGPTPTSLIGPNRWFFAVVNMGGGASTYSIVADETLSEASGETIDPNVRIVGDQLCLDWPSVVGRRYRIEGKSSIEDPSWGVLVESIEASSETTEFCFDLNSLGASFFQVIELEDETDPPVGGEPVAFINPGISLEDDTLCVSWDSEVGTAYRVEGKPTLADEWSVLRDGLVAESERTVECFDLGSIDARFFRIAELAPEDPGEPSRIFDPILSVNEDQLCLSWDATEGLTYQIEGKVTLADPWTITRGGIVASADQITECFDLTEVAERYFRIVELTPEEEEPGEGDVVVVDSDSTIEGSALCLEWESQPLYEYRIESQIFVGDEEWVTVREKIISDPEEDPGTTPQTTRLCIPLEDLESTTVRVIEVGEADPSDLDDDPIGFIDAGLTIDDTELCLTWDSEAGARYRIEGKATIADAWESLRDDIVASAETSTECFGLEGLEAVFFRVVALGTPSEGGGEETILESVTIERREDQICLLWDGDPLRTYRIESLDFAPGSEWEVVESAGSVTEFCLPLLEAQGRLFRVVEITPGSASEPEPGIAVEAESVEMRDGEICLEWRGKSGRRYRFERKSSLLGDWEAIPGIEATPGRRTLTEACLPMSGGEGAEFFRIIEIAE